jgi:antitoxin VapB
MNQQGGTKAANRKYHSKKEDRREAIMCIVTGRAFLQNEAKMINGIKGRSRARVFRSGNSQAVRLPKEFRFDSEEVEIFRRGDEVVLREKARDMQRAYQLLTELPEDFLRDGRNDIPPQTRKAL